MSRSLTLLSLDLDWFNYCKEHRLKEAITGFFANLRLRCTLPPTIAMMVEHQYVYPWAEAILKNNGVTCADIINIDQHHDFYAMASIYSFDANKASIGCENFFGYMAHNGMIDRYTWITSEKTPSGVLCRKSEVTSEMQYAKSFKVKSLRKRTNVYSCLDVWKVLDGKTIDGVAIVKSPYYTLNQKIVFSTVNSIIKKYFVNNGFSVRRNCRRSRFSNIKRNSMLVSV